MRSRRKRRANIGLLVARQAGQLRLDLPAFSASNPFQVRSIELK